MIWVSVKYTTICTFCIIVLETISWEGAKLEQATYVFLLLVDMSDLEPNVLFGKWSWWHRDNVAEAL